MSGSITAYFEDASLYTKFLDHTATSLSWSYTDGTRFMRITLPNVFFQTDAPAPTGIDQDVLESIDFTAVLDSTTNCQIQIDYIA